jgi:hypothetical protein
VDPRIVPGFRYRVRPIEDEVMKWQPHFVTITCGMIAICGVSTQKDTGCVLAAAILSCLLYEGYENQNVQNYNSVVCTLLRCDDMSLGTWFSMFRDDAVASSSRDEMSKKKGPIRRVETSGNNYTVKWRHIAETQRPRLHERNDTGWRRSRMGCWGRYLGLYEGKRRLNKTV